MQEQVQLSPTPTATKEMYPSIDSSAITFALQTSCSESEESSSSDDSFSSDDEGMEDESMRFNKGKPPSDAVNINVTSSSRAMPRRPTSLCISPTSNRRASCPSQRSHYATSRSNRSASHYSPSTISPRTPSVSMRHDAALRAFQLKQDNLDGKRTIKSKPFMVDLTAIPADAAPSIEIEQIFDDCKVNEEIGAEAAAAKKVQLEAKANDRSAARRNMLNALGRSQSKSASRPASSPSVKKSSLQGGSPVSPIVKSPNTASYFMHKRTNSCPSPTSPYNELLGNVNVFVTPPTPRPQEGHSPILGVSIGGMRGDDTNAFSSQLYKSNSLTPPPFELAPGKQRMAREQNAKALAWVATMQLQQQQMQMQLLYQQQQRFLLNTLQQQPLIGSCDTRALGIFDPNSSQDTSLVLSGMTSSPSMPLLLQQKAFQAQQQMMSQYSLSGFTPIEKKCLPRKSSQKGDRRTASKISPAGVVESATSKSWWRKEAKIANIADTPVSWRRRESDSTSQIPEIKSAKPVYLPPGKRAALDNQRQLLRSRA